MINAIPQPVKGEPSVSTASVHKRLGGVGDTMHYLGKKAGGEWKEGLEQSHYRHHNESSKHNEFSK
jgi:hypothetical protein